MPGRTGANRAAAERSRRIEWQPAPTLQGFKRREASLVVHLGMCVDPVAEIEVRMAEALCPGDLLQDREAAQRARAQLGIEVGVDRRECIRQYIGCGHTHQAPAQAQLEEARRRPLAAQESVEILRLGLVHATARMTAGE